MDFFKSWIKTDIKTECDTSGIYVKIPTCVLDTLDIDQSNLQARLQT